MEEKKENGKGKNQICCDFFSAAVALNEKKVK